MSRQPRDRFTISFALVIACGPQSEDDDGVVGETTSALAVATDPCPSDEDHCGDPCADDPSKCGPLAPYTAEGCLRDACRAGNPCPGGQLCYPAFAVSFECRIEASQCVCAGLGAFCQGYCVAAEDYPEGTPDAACGE
jgi:hypothetical protein